MSVLDQLKELDKQREKLINSAKSEALKKAEAAVAELNALGFNYTLSEAGTRSTSTGTRRSGIRQDVFDLIKSTQGLSRADVLDRMNAKGDKSAEQSISNALSALKKQGQVTLDNGVYSAK